MAVITGDNNDSIHLDGGIAADLISGLDGSDILNGNGGGDILIGGAGLDGMFGETITESAGPELLPGAHLLHVCCLNEEERGSDVPSRETRDLLQDGRLERDGAGTPARSERRTCIATAQLFL